MTAEAIAPKLFAWNPDWAISRFFRKMKPEYSILAAEFIGGLALGGSAGVLRAHNQSLLGAGCGIMAPLFLDYSIDYCLTSDLPSAPNHLSPRAMRTFSLVAAFTGSIIGESLTLSALKPQHYREFLVVQAALKTLYTVHTARNRWRHPYGGGPPPTIGL